jgi:hypothetical protein
VGCGTGENALHITSLGLSVLSIDVAETAWRSPGRRPKTVGSTLSSLRLTLQTVLDSGLFHVVTISALPAPAVATTHCGSLSARVFRQLLA